MRGHLILGLAMVLGSIVPVSAAEEPAGHVVIVLDCSAHMDAPLSVDRAEPSRFEAARQATELLLTRLAQSERHGVTLVLAGHRIAPAGEPAEGQAAQGQAAGEDSQSVQVDYLKLEAGKLERVPPGLDVEIVRESNPLSPEHLEAYRETLASLKPWGDSPLWLAIEKAAKSAPRTAGQPARIVLVTGGTNEQSGVQKPSTSQQALAALKSQGASLHVVQLGKVRSSVDLAAIKHAAEATGGGILSPKQESHVTQALLIAAGLETAKPVAQSSNPEPAATADRRPVAQVALTQDAVVQPPPVVIVRDDDALRAQLLKKDVIIEIRYWSEPVKDAKVYLRGKSFDLEYSRDGEAADKLLRENRLSGIYIFPKVLHGAYLLDITVNFRNRKYAIEREIVVDDDLLEPGRRLIIQIERSKDPPPAPAPTPGP